ncbi:cell division ATP-binding protein FtsE [Sedimentibacter hydroxybenzoicus DSM 7310]|uniref:Cell division ATP-binding protein FtsE n=1 Tax=Sedimentibacter hydroxybenzoicus DSM 7310 TaxID=1123245 RepID=A0A974GVZ7_SEDHY|nr:cell division ATP-binding protein FtsE [Sedimentibacter hydroxybenzoicus]NYB73942.1 cell division ATP-binding protein FtsE [Sedimentibacter hydroxybenzoicus DSM 7310]
MIEFNNVTKVYKNEFTAVKNINLKIEKGEFLFIVGKSGAGKSTLIKLLLREINPTEGIITYNNQNITKIRKRNIAEYRRNIGFIFQDYRLLPKLTVYENVAFAMEMICCNAKNIRREVPLVLSMVGLSDKAKYYPDELSGGEQQRVAIARAVINKPETIIADEPTGNLDQETSKEIMKILTEINKRGTAVIMATHDREIINQYQKRVIELKQGVIIRDMKTGGYSNDNKKA